MAKKAPVKTIKSKLLDIAKYLEEAGMCGAKEVRKAMDAIDGSFVDDADYSVDQMIPDNQLALPGSMPVALHGGEGGRPNPFNPGESVLRGSILHSVISRLIKTANKLDKSEHHDEADEIDELLKELLSGEELEIIKDLEEKECNKKKQRVKPEEDEDKEGTDVLVQSNGHVGTGVTDNSNAGMFSGFSDAYFFSGYGNLEGAYGPTDR